MARLRKQKTDDLLDDLKREFLKTGRWPENTPPDLAFHMLDFCYGDPAGRREFVEQEKQRKRS
jgi:hypothetical protein